MSGILSAGGAGAVGASGSFYPVTIDDSLRWPASGSQLFRTVGVPTDAKKHTHSFWVKVNPGTTQTLNSVYGNASGYYSVSGINSDGRIIFAADYARYYYSTMVLRDPSSWVHILQVLDSTEASNSDRMKLYVNGVRQTSFTNFATVPLNWTGSYHATNGLGLRIGRTYTGAGFQSSLLSYTSEYIFVDGQALDPTDFGQFKDGVWIPDTYAGTYGNNGYKLDFSNPANFGEDSSGNSNNFSVTGLSAHDAMPDTPTNNFCTLNPLDKLNSPTLSEGNLQYYPNVNGVARSTLGFNTGKLYFEIYQASTVSPSTPFGYGLCELEGNVTHTAFKQGLLVYGDNGAGHSVLTYVNGSLVQDDTGYFSTTAVGDVWQFAYDADTGKVWVGRNGTWFNSGDPAAGTGYIYQFSGDYTIGPVMDHAAANYTAILNTGQDSTFAGATTAGGNTDGNGKGDFKYAPPAGYLALCSANLPTPSIVDGSEHFNTVLYTGDNADRNIDVGFKSDFVWLKHRNGTSHHRLYDSIRGDGQALFSNLTNAEYNGVDDGVEFAYADGFNIDVGANVSNYNGSGGTYAAWNWKAGGAAVSNTDGSITSQVSANVDAGFSIVTWFANSATGTVGHGLNKAPELVIAKPRDDSGTNWYVMHTGALTASQVLNLDTTGAAYTPGVAHFNSTYPTSSVISYGGYLGNALTNNNKLAYCFHSVDGFSKCGSYVGNGSADGPFVYTGFRPSFILTKRSETGGSWWEMVDTEREPVNPSDQTLYANVSDAEYTSSVYDKDLLSNGFKIRGTNAGHNASGGTYIYLAFAEHPFKYANAR